MKPRHFLRIAILAVLVFGCTPTAAPLDPSPTAGSSPVASVTDTPQPLPSDTPVPVLTDTSAPAVTATSAPSPTGATGTGEEPEEAIVILSPGPGSRLVSPIRISGEADPTFEQSLAARVVLDDGTELAVVPVQIQADIGQRGPFEAEIPFTISGERQAIIQIFATSARDGGTTHFASAGVILADSGAENIVANSPHSERIQIFEPAMNATISGGIVHVEGFALASFEQHLLVEVLDQEGNVIGSEPVTVQAPDLGQPGPFEVNVRYIGGTPGPGRVLVLDPSPAFEGVLHLSSVEITFE